MNTKTKNSSIDRVLSATQRSGMTFMTLAAMLGIIELPHHMMGGAGVIGRAATVIVSEQRTGEDMSTQRREREEAGPHYVSYSAAQRTPGRMGRY